MKKSFEILNSATPYQGFFRLETHQLRHTLFKGGLSPVIQREVFRRSNCVGVLLYDPERDEVVLIEQFRMGAAVQTEHAWLLEIVAGGIEEDETPEQVAYREAEEEAGCAIEKLEFISRFYTSPGGTSELLSLYCGKVDTRKIGGVYGLAEENEDILVSVVSFAEAFSLVEQNKIESAIPIIAIQWLALNKDKLRTKWLTA